MKIRENTEPPRPMKKNALSAFTLIEMLTVMAIIAVVASLVVAVNGLVNKKAATARADAEIHAISAACESYKADNGVYPQNDDTDLLDPRRDAVPTDKKYEDASRFLYSQLSGDTLPENRPDGKPENDSKVYFEFKPNMLGANKDKTSGKVTEVKSIQDPFGLTYGYSTAAAKAETEYLQDLRKDPTAKREGKTPGYNSAGFDMWSTGGSTSKTPGTSSGEVDQSRWVKNW